jgi:hypothetical protein
MLIGALPATLYVFEHSSGTLLQQRSRVHNIHSYVYMFNIYSTNGYAIYVRRKLSLAVRVQRDFIMKSDLSNSLLFSGFKLKNKKPTRVADRDVRLTRGSLRLLRNGRKLGTISRCDVHLRRRAKFIKNKLQAYGICCWLLPSSPRLALRAVMSAQRQAQRTAPAPVYV